jgi:hypothetical protein
MALRISTAARNSQVSNIRTLFAAGVLEIRSGSQPSSADDAPSGTLLASITLPNPAWNVAASGQITKTGTWQDTSADATGTAGWFRLRQSADAGTTNTTDERVDGNITVTGGGGNMTLDNTSITSTQQVTINTFTVTQPANA